MRRLSLLIKVTLAVIWLVAGVACTDLTTPHTTVPGWESAPSGPPASTARFSAPPTEPLLRLDTGMHTAAIRRIGVDAANRYLVTGSHDKTVRVWELTTGRLLMTLRPPIGAGYEGSISAVAISPDGTTVAVAGWTGRAWDPSYSIYLFDWQSGQLRQNLSGLSATVFHLAYSRDGSFLVATLWGTNGIRVYRTQDYSQAASDEDYGSDSYGADFDPGGRLVTASLDGFVRLYDRNFQLLVKRQVPGGEHPYAVAFSPDGTRVAVGFDDSARVEVVSGQDLSPLYTPDATGVGNGNLLSICWSADGRWLYAAGQYNVRGMRSIRRWADGGQGAFQDLPAATNTILHLLPLQGGGVAFGASDPAFGVLAPSGQRQLFQASATADFRDNWQGFRLTREGATVQFSYEQWGKSPARFSLHDRTLTLQPGQNRSLLPPVTTAPGLKITAWKNTTAPALKGTILQLQQYEVSRSLAITPDRRHFLLGTEWYIRLFDSRGVEQWHRPSPGPAWAVNVTANGQMAVAAFGDGTIRWYRLHDGTELLAFFPHRDRKRWVLWTPAGYYDASPGAEELIGWHVNRGRDEAADFFSVGRFRSAYFRPDVVAEVLQTLDEAEAVQRTNAAAQRQHQAVEVAQRLPPVIQMLAPQDGTTVSTPEVTVRFSVRSPSGEPVTSLKGLVDGRPVVRDRGLQIVANDGEVRELRIPLPQRDCDVTIIAENRYAASEPATIRLQWRGASAESTSKPRLYVLAIGISRYHTQRLPQGFAATDAQDFVAALQRQQGEMYREVAVKLLTDAPATRAGILDGLAWLAQQTTSKDVAVIFVAGYGVNDHKGDYYFLPVDVDTDRLQSTGVSLVDLKNTVAELAGKVLFFIDTCHSGHIMEQRSGAQDLTGVINALASTENGAVVFAACTGNPYSPEDRTWSDGAFTKALVEGLGGQADYSGRGRITVNMLALYLAQRVKELTQGQQTPTMAKPHSVPDFPVALVQ